MRYWGESNREIVSFRSCVRASGRGEAKLRGRARGDEVWEARAWRDQLTPPGPGPGRGSSRGCPGPGGEVWEAKSYPNPILILS